MICLSSIIREIGNKFFLFSANTNSTPTVTIPTNTRMDFENVFRNTSDNYDEVRNRTSTPSKQSFRAFSMFSTVSLVIYHKRMEMNNNLEGDVEIKPTKMT